MRSTPLLPFLLTALSGACASGARGPDPSPAPPAAPAAASAAAPAATSAPGSPAVRAPESTLVRATALLDAARDARAAVDLDGARAKGAEGIELLLGDEAALAESSGTDALSELGTLSSDLGDLPAAERARRKLVDVLSKTLPDDHPDLSAAREDLGVTLYRRGDIPGARELFQKVFDVVSRALPDDHPDVQKARQALAISVQATGDLKGARAIEEKVLEIDARTLPDDHPDLQKARQNLAITIKLLGDLQGARALEEKVLEVRTRTLPDDHPDLQAIRGNLATTIEALGDLEGARALEEKVVEVFTRTLPEDHPDIQRARLNLSTTLYTLGDLSSARTLIESVVDALAKSLPDDHPDLQGARLNLAIVIKDLGDLAGARALEERVLEIDSRMFPDDYPHLMEARSSLAVTLESMGDHAGALALKEKVLEVCSKTLPEDHPNLQKARQNLAITLTAMGELDRARELQEMVLEVRSRTLPESHPDLLATRTNLATTKYLLGDFAGALSDLEEVYAVSSKTLPDDHPDLQDRRQDLAAALAALSGTERSADDVRRERARRFDALTREYIRALRHFTSAAITESSSREAEERVASQSGALSSALSLASGAGNMGDDEAREREVFLVSETMRGAALASARLARAARSDSSYASTKARARAASEELARLAQSGGGADEFARSRKELESAERDLVRLARQLHGAHSTSLDPDLDALAARVKEGEALIAYRRYRRTILPSAEHGKETSVESVCAFVLRSGGKLARVELGPIDAIEEAVVHWRESIAVDPNRGVAADPGRAETATTRGRELRALVLDPLDGALAGVGRAIVALDDVLHAVALDALPDRVAGKTDSVEPLGSRLRIETRTSLLELLAEDPPRSGEASLLALGDAAFNSAPVAYSSPPEDAPALAMAPARAPSDAGVLRGGAWERGFSVLPETRAEVATIGETFSEVFGEGPRALVLERRKASRENLFEIAPRSRFLHVATHGWFAPDSVRSSDDPEPIDKFVSAGHRTSAEERVRGMVPMLMSGVALAGANLPAEATGRIPGLVTAAELATLDLSNCELAVLSACDSNVGVRRGGQGVASLQRALHMAGARSVITSLWKVPDEATKELMVDFYRRLWVEKKPKAQALWEAKMKLRNAKDETGKPIYSVRDWAAWVLTGDPG